MGTSSRLSPEAALFVALLGDVAVRARLGEEPANRAIAAIVGDPRLQSREDRPSARAVILAPVLSDLAGWAVQSPGAARGNVGPAEILLAALGGQPSSSASFEAARAVLRRAGIGPESLVRGPSPLAQIDLGFPGIDRSTDLTRKAEAGFWPDCPLIGSEQVLDFLVRQLNGTRESVLIVGPPGVGKTTLVDGLAWHLARRSALIPPRLRGRRVVSVSAESLVAGAGLQGDLEQNIAKMIDTLVKNPHVIAFFDEVHRLLDLTSPVGRATADQLKPALGDHGIQIVGATTDAEYARFIDNDPAFKRRFAVVTVSEPTPDETRQILRQGEPAILGPIGAELGIRLDETGLAEAIRLTSRYERLDYQPAKARRLLRGAVADLVYESDMRTAAGGSRSVDAAATRATFSRRTGIPLYELEPSELGYAEALERELSTGVKGQPAAIRAVASHLERARWGWSPPGRPRGRFLFLGPPGVGKTELAKGIAQHALFDPLAVTTKNMGEFKGESARNAWRGADPGYVGFGGVETVYSRVRTRPHSVVVLDEFEKADRSLADVLLSVFDGSGEDGQGRVTDFTSTIFVLTSNAIEALVEDLHEVAGSTDQGDIDRLDGLLRQGLLSMRERFPIFTPPLVDRIDRIVFFRPLSRATLLQVLDVTLARWRKNAVRALPDRLATAEAREEIMAIAEMAGVASARGLERAVQVWLDRERSTPG